MNSKNTCDKTVAGVFNSKDEILRITFPEAERHGEV